MWDEASLDAYLENPRAVVKGTRTAFPGIKATADRAAFIACPKSPPLSWAAGNRSALDTAAIAKGRDVGNVVVQRETASGALSMSRTALTFAFVFHAFHPDAPLHR